MVPFSVTGEDVEIGRSLTHCGACGSATVVPDTERSRRSRQFSQSEPPAEAKEGKVIRRGSWGNSSTYRSSRLSSTSVIISPISPSEQHTTRDLRSSSQPDPTQTAQKARAASQVPTAIGHRPNTTQKILLPTKTKNRIVFTVVQKSTVRHHALSRISVSG